ncbi:MAG: DUF4249 family protein [Ignavibacteriaceae bacterium]|nr:DUF4249 family protein [Ignavibacteriaceae bacterium]
MKKYSYLLVLINTLLYLSGCGEGHVDITDASYSPKIVINAYIFGGQKVKDIKITRNIPLTQSIDTSTIILQNALVKIIDLGNNKVYTLTYNPINYSFEYTGNDLIIDYGKSYKIDVQAIIDGQDLHASSTTVVPLSGLKADKPDLGSMTYRETNANGDVNKINISFKPSGNSSATIFSIVALDASVGSFIYNNYYYSETDTQKIAHALDRYKQNYAFQINIAPGTQDFTMALDWFTIWFYGRYRVIIYAADKNFYDYFITAQNVMELDGNFHEPQMHIDGDGIGVFGSAVTDTVYFSVKQ